MTEAERNALVVEYLPLIGRIVRSLVACGLPAFVDRDDIKQEAAMRLITAIDRYDGRNGASRETFLRKVIRQDLLDAIDKQWRKDRYSLVHDDPRQAGTRLISGAHHVSEWRKTLTRKQAQAMELVYVYGFTQERAADKLGIHRVSVAKRLRSAVIRLKNIQT
jgi:RNA polymerase sigma factor (sigma-70 family)